MPSPAPSMGSGLPSTIMCEMQYLQLHLKQLWVRGKSLLPGSDDRPADVLLPFWANGKDAALDISVVNPLQQELVRKVARDGDSGVQHSFNIKMGKYSDRCEAEGIEFIPLIVDTFGGWHKESLEVVSKLGRQVSRQTGKEEEEIVRQLRQRVAILLVRDSMFDSRTPSLSSRSN